MRCMSEGVWGCEGGMAEETNDFDDDEMMALGLRLVKLKTVDEATEED